MAVAGALACTGAPAASAAGLLAYEVVGDAVPAALGGLEGDARRGRRVPVEDEPFQGEIGPPLAGVGAHLDEGQLRLRLIDQSRLNPQTLMPPYYRVDDLHAVAPAYRGEPALDAQSIEDVVAWLATLTEPPNP